MNFLTNTYKVGNTLVPSKGTHAMYIKEIKINKISNSKNKPATYKCSIKYMNGTIDPEVKFRGQEIEKFSLKLKDLLSAL